MHIKDAKFCAIDIETTGLNPRKDEMIAFACMPIFHMRILVRDTFYTLIKPKRYSYDAMKYHGISKDNLMDAPVFEAAADGILKLLDGVLVGHSVEFDYGFLKMYFKKTGVNLKRECLDIAGIERWLRQKRRNPDMDLSFDAMMDSYGLKQYYRHNAAADAFFAAQIFQMQMRQMPDLGVDTVDMLIKAAKSCSYADCDFVFF
jgi:DNA polymerase III subunit epsilon